MVFTISAQKCRKIFERGVCFCLKVKIHYLMVQLTIRSQYYQHFFYFFHQRQELKLFL
jgi:hypothetical protein